MKSPEIIVVGSYVQDLVFQCAEFPRPGETVIGRSMTTHGGKGSNQAVAAARAGGRVAFIGSLGADAAAEGARAFHASEGIMSLAETKPGQATGAAGIVVNALGQNQIIVALNANDALTPADIDAQATVIRGARIAVVQLETNLGAVAHTLRLAHASGVTTILNPAPMRADFDAAVLADTRILIPNETEFCALVERRPAARALAGSALDEQSLAALTESELHGLCRALEVDTVIVTLGKRGCFVSQRDRWEMIAGVAEVQAVDTTGAGDAFVGAFATALAELGEAAVGQAARFANAAAAVSVSRSGAAQSMARRPEIEMMLRRVGETC